MSQTWKSTTVHQFWFVFIHHIHTHTLNIQFIRYTCNRFNCVLLYHIGDSPKCGYFPDKLVNKCTDLYSSNVYVPVYGKGNYFIYYSELINLHFIVNFINQMYFSYFKTSLPFCSPNK